MHVLVTRVFMGILISGLYSTELYPQNCPTFLYSYTYGQPANIIRNRLYGNLKPSSEGPQWTQCDNCTPHIQYCGDKEHFDASRDIASSHMHACV